MVIFAKIITTFVFGGLGFLALGSLIWAFMVAGNWRKDEHCRMAFAVILFLACVYIVIALWV